MKSQEELWAEYERLKQAEDWEAALKLLDLIEPVSDEEWHRRLREAPMDDGPRTPRGREGLEEAHRALAKMHGLSTG